MLRPKAVNAFALDDSRILVEFDTGERKIMDVPYIKGEWYGMLSDPSCFRTIGTNRYKTTADNPYARIGAECGSAIFHIASYMKLCSCGIICICGRRTVSGFIRQTSRSSR